jgi:hypothetical protein
VAFLRDIEKLIQIKLPVTERRTNPRAEAAPHHRPQNAGRNGRNGNRRNGQQQRRNGGGGNGHQGQQQRRSENGHHGKPRRNDGAQHGQPRQNGENRHAPSTAASSPDNIGTVAFMQRPHRPQADRGAR